MPGVTQTDVARQSSAQHLPARRPRPHPLAVVAGLVVTAAGVGLRFYCPSALWLDETISVNISKLPLSQIPGGLREDGAPPLYYVMLHFWMLAFGQGDVAVRALSGVTSLVTLPLLWLAGRRLGGRRLGWLVYFLALTSPFLIEYATTTRMYSLMVLMSTLGFLALTWALESPTPRRLVPLGLVTAAILYTHYWGLYLVVVTGLWLLYHMWRHQRGLPSRQNPSAVRRCFLAMLVGSLLFIPWAPIFVFQSLHTGTPWASPAGPADLLNTFSDYAGLTGPWAELLAFCYFTLLVLGVFVRPAVISRRRNRAGGDGVGQGNGAGDGARHGHGNGNGVGNGAGTGPEDEGAAGEIGAEEDDAELGVGSLRLETSEVGLTDHEAELAADIDRDPEGIGSAARRGIDRAVGWAGFGPGGAAGRPPGEGTVLLLGRNPQTLPLFGVLFGTLLFAMLAGAVAQAAFVARYAAVVLPLFLLIVASGLTIIGRARLVAGALAVMCIAGVVTGYTDNAQPRTQAVQVAQVLNTQAQPGDVVVYCPDQLGPAVDRLLRVPQVTELTFPRAIGPQRVDWINYVQVIRHTNVEAFAQDMASRVGPDNTLWLVWNRSYHGFGRDCGDLETWLSYFLPGSGTTLFQADSTYYENELLTRYPSEATSSAP